MSFTIIHRTQEEFLAAKAALDRLFTIRPDHLIGDPVYREPWSASEQIH